MITILRRNQRWMMFLIAILTIVAFAWLYNTTDTEKVGANQVASMYGKTVFQVDIDRAVRLYQLAAILGMNEFLGRMTSTAKNADEALEAFVWNLLVLRHEADALWIRQTDEQVVEGVRSLPALRKEGEFDRSLYMQFLQNELAPRGLTERHLEDLVRDSLSLDRIAALAASPVSAGLGEMGEAQKLMSAVDAWVVRIGAPAKGKAVAATEEEVAAFFEENRGKLLTPEFRNARLARIRLAPEKQNLEGKEKVEALQEAANRISRLHEILQGGGSLEEAAEETHAEVVDAGWVDARGSRPSENPAEAGEKSDLPSPLVAEIFRMSPERFLGDIVQDGPDFYVAVWNNQRPARELTLDEVRPKIAEALSRQKDAQEKRVAAEGILGKIREAVAGGAEIGDAAKSAGATAERLTNLEPWSQQPGPNSLLARTTLPLAEGEIGDLQESPEGFFFVQLEKRHPVNEIIALQRGDELRRGLVDAKKRLLLMEWFRVSREKSNLRFFARSS